MKVIKYAAVRRGGETECEFILDSELGSCPGLVKAAVHVTAQQDAYRDLESPVIRIVKVEIREVPE